MRLRRIPVVLLVVLTAFSLGCSRETVVYSELNLGMGGTLSVGFDNNKWDVRQGSLKYLVKNSWNPAESAAYADCTANLGSSCPGFSMGFSKPNDTVTPDHMRVLSVDALPQNPGVAYRVRLQATLKSTT